MALTFPQAEAAVVGSLLIDPDRVMPILAEALLPEDFGDATLRHLYDAARGLWLNGRPVDAVTIGAAAGSPQDYAEVASELMETTPSASSVESYAEIVRHDAQLRALRTIGVQLAACGDLSEARALAQKAADATGDRRSESGRMWRDLATEYFAHMSDPPQPWLDLGIPELSRAVRMRAGQFVVLGAYNSVGKTAFALQMAFAMAASGKRVGFFSLETPADTLTQRVIAQQTGARMRDIMDHRCSDTDARAAMDLGQRSWDYPLTFYNASGWTVSDIRARCLAQRLQVAFVDYVQLLAGPGDNPALQVRAVSMGLHELAQQTGVTVIALSQVTPQKNMNTGKRLPLRKEHLRESQQLSNDADIVLLLDLTDQEDYNSPRVLLIDKNKDVGRNGMTLAFDGPRLRFSYLPTVVENEEAPAKERTAKMDANREKKRKKEAEAEAAREADENAWVRMAEGAEGEEGLPL